MPTPEIRITPLSDAADARAFREINEDWISRMFTLTDSDRTLLADPVTRIVEPGGDVLIARDGSGEAVGCVAVIAYGEGVFELAKMGVRPEAQGGGIGRRLVEAGVRRAAELGGRRLFLGTNGRLAPAVHLYEQAGFRRITREQLPVADYYARADILMERRLDPDPRSADSEEAGTAPLPVLDYLRREVDGTLRPGERTHLRYPTAISGLLGFRTTAVGRGSATIEVEADPRSHGNQQGTVHGGFLVELADAAIGTAQSTLLTEGESFASVELSARFLRPVWSGRLTAVATVTHAGRTLSHFDCAITRADGKPVAAVTSVVMTLRGDDAAGR